MLLFVIFKICLRAIIKNSGGLIKGIVNSTLQPINEINCKSYVIYFLKNRI